jgi:hypothetical protein
MTGRFRWQRGLKVAVYGRSITGIAGLKSAVLMNVSGEYCVLLRKVLGDRPITGPGGLSTVVHQRVIE